MGNQSSQLEETGGMPQRGSRIIGPSMSPTPEPEDMHSNAAAPGNGASATDDTMEPPSPSGQSSKKKEKEKEKEKQRRTKEKEKRTERLDYEAASHASQEGSAAGDEEAAAQDTAKQRKKKKKSRTAHPEATQAGEEAVIAHTLPEPPIEHVKEPYPSPKRKKKRARINTLREDELPLQNDAQEEGLFNSNNTPGDAEAVRQAGCQVEDAPPDDILGPALHVLQSPSSGKKKQSRRRKTGNTPSSDAQQFLVSHAVGGSPPSAQPPDVNSILKYEPVMDDDEDDVSVIPSSQWPQTRRESVQSLRPNQMKRESLNDNQGSGEELQFHFAGIAATNFADAVTDPVAEARRENDPDNGLGWLHKRDNASQQTPFTGARETQLGPTSPDLLPSQIKTEAELDNDGDSNSDSSIESKSSSSRESDSHSPSVQKFERLSRSRSRSASRAPSRAGHLADLALGLSATARPDPYQQVPYSAPSSTGSNRSIPAHIEPQPSLSLSKFSRSRRSSQVSRNSTAADPDAMDVDQPVVQDHRSPKQRTKKATLEKGREIISPVQPNEVGAGTEVADPTDADAGTQAVQSRIQNQRRQSKVALTDRNLHLIANGLSNLAKGTITQSAAHSPDLDAVSDDEVPLDSIPATYEVQPVQSERRPLKSKGRQSKPSLVLDDDVLDLQNTSTVPEPVVENDEPAASPKRKGKKRALRNSAAADDPVAESVSTKEDRAADLDPGVAADAGATHNDNVEPGQSADQAQLKPQPKSKKKRMLGQSKVSLSLSQIEGDEDEDDFSTTFARKKSTKNPTVGDSHEPEQSKVGGSQAPSPEKPRKPKRKRRAAINASDDEMESLLAAGPAKRRKGANSLGLSDHEEGGEGKRKRASSASKSKATGPWTQRELNDLGKVVEDFMDENRLTQHELNQLVQQAPNKAKSVNKDFWDKAEQAIPQRTRKQITERARRIYHNFVARGTWTEEQKEEVHELFQTHPKKWAEIAVMINRDQKDVRDYWRNQYLVLESQIKSRWSKDEEERLKEVVEEALSRIRITRENSDESRHSSRAKSVEDDAMLDWQQISAAMDLTRSRQQCRWKWVDMREKGLVGDESILLPTQPRGSTEPNGNMTNGISEKLANAREDYRGMGPEDKFRLIDAIKDSGVREDKHIPWRTLVDERFRTKWHRPTLRLVWYRLRQTVPNYEDQDVEANARHLVNYYHMHQMPPRFDDNQADEQIEEQVVHYKRGKRIWKRPSGDLRAVRERQRRSSSVSTRASSRLSRKVSSEILNLSEDEEAAGRPSTSRQSAELGEERGRRAGRDGLQSDEVLVNIPGHLKGEAAKKALAQARAKAKGRRKEMAANERRQARSKSVAVDSDSE